MATSGTPGPVVLVIPEDIQQQQVPQPKWAARGHASVKPDDATLRELLRLLATAERP